MADAHHSESNAPTVMIGVVFSALCLAALGYWFSTLVQPVDKSSFEFAPLTIEADKLEQQRTARYESDLDPKDERVKKLLDVLRQANAEQFGSPDNATKLTRAKEIQIASNEVLELDGMKGFHQVGTNFIQSCDNALQKALGADEEKVRTDGDYQDYREYCGDLIPHLKRLGLLTETGAWKDPDVSPELVRILSRYRWAFIHARRTPVWEQMAPYEYELLENWRIKTKGSFSADERIKLAKRAAERIDGFPLDEVIASIHIQEDKLALANPHMARVCKNTKSIEWKTKCRWFDENHVPKNAETPAETTQ